jgi:hypothetical protein
MAHPPPFATIIASANRLPIWNQMMFAGADEVSATHLFQCLA